MALGFFLGVRKGIGRIMDPSGKIMEVPLARIPKGLQPGQDFNYRASSSGNFRIAEPVSVRKRASNSAKDRQQYAMQRLMKKGWTAPQAAGIVGRFMVEAFPDLRTTAIGDREIPGGSLGIGQWNRERKAALEAFATGRASGKYSDNPLVVAAAKAGGNGEVGNLDTQIDFFDWEVRNSPSERIAYSALRASKTAEDAGTAMMHYERPRGYLSKSPSSGLHWNKTVRNAQSVMKSYDPNYEFKVDFTGNQRAIDMANLATRDETGDLVVMEQSQDDPGFMTMDEDESVINSGEKKREKTLGDLMGGGVEETEMSPGMGPDTSRVRAEIDASIERGRQASMSPLPSLRDVFGG